MALKQGFIFVLHIYKQNRNLLYLMQSIVYNYNKNHFYNSLTSKKTNTKVHSNYINEIYGEGNAYTTDFRELDTRLCRWWSIDPLAKKYSGWSPYASFNDNPIYFTDPTGMEGEGFIKDKKNNVTYWDENINSQEDFEKSGLDAENFSYEGQEYSTPSGTLSVPEFTTYGDLDPNPSDRDFTGVTITLEFTPKEGTEVVGSMQTFSTNWEGQNFAAYQWGYPGVTPIVTDQPQEYVDANWSADPTVSTFYSKGGNFTDMPARASSGGKSVTWQAQTTYITKVDNNYVRAVTVTYGFVVHPSGKVDYNTLTITENISDFHRIAFESLPK